MQEYVLGVGLGDGLGDGLGEGLGLAVGATTETGTEQFAVVVPLLMLAVLVSTVPAVTVFANLTLKTTAELLLADNVAAGQLNVLVAGSYAPVPQLLSTNVKLSRLFPVKGSVIVIGTLVVPLLLMFTWNTTVSPGMKLD